MTSNSNKHSDIFESDSWYIQNIKEISQFTDLQPLPLTQRATRQEWPCIRIQEGGGLPTRYYPLPTLPDTIQTAWAEHATEEEAKDATAWPLRNGAYKLVKEGRGKPKEVYDAGKRDIGLSKPAREILLSRFPKLNDIEPGSITPELPEGIFEKKTEAKQDEEQPHTQPTIQSETTSEVASERVVQTKDEVISAKDRIITTKDEVIAAQKERLEAQETQLNELRSIVQEFLAKEKDIRALVEDNRKLGMLRFEMKLHIAELERLLTDTDIPAPARQVLDRAAQSLTRS